MRLNFNMYFAGIGGPTNKINQTHYSLLTTIVLLLSHFLLCPSFLDRDVARSTFLHLHFHRIPEPFFQQRSTSLTNDNRRRCVMFLIVIRSIYRLKLFTAVNANFTFSCLVCFSWQYPPGVIKRRPRLLAFHLSIHFESFNSTLLNFKFCFESLFNAILAPDQHIQYQPNFTFILMQRNIRYLITK